MVILALFSIFALAVHLAGDNVIWLRLSQWLCFAAFALTLFLKNGKGRGAPTSEITFSKSSLVVSFLSIFILGFFIYAGTLNLRFLDADDFIHMADAKNLVENFGFYYYTDFFIFVKGQDAEQLVRPLLNIPFIIGYLLFGKNPLGYHFLNIFAHTLAGFFICLIAYLLSDKYKLGMLAGALYVAQPVLSRPIAWTAALTHTFPTLYFLIALFFYLLYRRKSGNRGFFCLACLFMFLDMAAWELGFLLPFVFLAADLIFLQGLFKAEEALKWLKPHIITFSIVALYIGQIILRVWLLEIDVGRQYAKDRLTLDSPLLLIHYLNAFVDGFLRPFHRGLFFGLSYKMAVAFWILGHWVLLIVLAGGKRFNFKLVLFGFFFAILSYLPVYGSPQVNMEFLMRARVLMFPAIGFSLALASMLYPYKKQPGKLVMAVIVAIPLLFGIMAAKNNDAWKSISQKQANMESQVYPILKKHGLRSPVVVLLQADVRRDMDVHRDLFETLYAKVQFESPDPLRIWHLTYSTYLIFSPLEDMTMVPVGKWPVLIYSDMNLKSFSDKTQSLSDWAIGYITGGSQIHGSRRLIAPGDTLHKGWPNKTIPVGQTLGRNLTIEAKTHVISNDRMRLHIPTAH